MAGYVELFIDQGTSFNNIINLTDDLTDDYINVSGYTVTSKMRKSFYSQNSSANITCTITDQVNGGITMSMTAANTANLAAGRYVFDVKALTTSNDVIRIIEGMITVTPQVTR